MSAPRAIDALVIGASAGGVEALGMLLPALRPGLRVAVFVVIHLPRERPSVIADLLAQRCAVPIREADDKEPVVPGTVYFAPPDYHLLIERGPSLALSFDPPVNFSRPSIDVLFESAADVYGRRLAGLILTGANEDGALGLDAVRRAGGVTLVQDPDSAQVSAMPLAALARGPVDHVLPLSGIAAWLTALASLREEDAA
jgi:two-component system chemotaxis response regulator CheB